MSSRSRRAPPASGASRAVAGQEVDGQNGAQARVADERLVADDGGAARRHQGGAEPAQRRAIAGREVDHQQRGAVRGEEAIPRRVDRHGAHRRKRRPGAGRGVGQDAAVAGTEVHGEDGGVARVPDQGAVADRIQGQHPRVLQRGPGARSVVGEDGAVP
ncbi:MAG: hypothetical protein ACYTEZ_19700 [Planctomycetota bacterium]|jgi:hypothetical protein